MVIQRDHEEKFQRYKINRNKSKSAFNNRRNRPKELISKISARLPTSFGDFKINLYKDNEGKENIALVMGNIKGKSNVLVRVHSECFTGDIFDSMRCDCGEQLRQSIQIITEEREGILLYLRQEGRGIGLIEKLKTYNLQDQGLDTVEANIALGHEADERDYSIAAKILKDLGVSSIRLISNNPTKFNFLDEEGIKIVSRIPLYPRITSENVHYLSTKISKMSHLMDLDSLTASSPEREAIIRYLSNLQNSFKKRDWPFIVLSYAQSIDGFISFNRKERLEISGQESKILTHELRSKHDAILVGINTILSDDPKLNTRLIKGKSPIPIVLDTNFKFPTDAKLLKNEISPWIIIGKNLEITKRNKLEALGSRIIRMPHNKGYIELTPLLKELFNRGIKSIMVEGGARIISSFIKEELVNMIILAISPFFIGNGLHSLEEEFFKENHKLFSLENSRVAKLGDDFVIYGVPQWM